MNHIIAGVIILVVLFVSYVTPVHATKETYYNIPNGPMTIHSQTMAAVNYNNNSSSGSSSSGSSSGSGYNTGIAVPPTHNVPEPGTVLLIGIGLLGIALTTRNKK